MRYRLFLNYSLSIFIIFIFNSCKKEVNSNVHSGVVFYPANQNLVLNNLFSSSNDGQTISIPIYNNSFYKFSNIINYSLGSNKNLNDMTIDMNDSNQLNVLFKIRPDKYIGVSSDKTKPFIYQSNIFYQDKLVLLDKNLNLLTQSVVEDTINYYSHFKSLDNGNFILIYSSFRSNNALLMLCFDENLKVKWKTQMTQNIFSDLCVSNGNIYILEKVYYTANPTFFIRQYGIDGKFIKSKTSNPSYSNLRIINSDDGFNTLGLFNNTTNKRNLLVVSRYNSNSELIETKLLDTKLFSFNEAFKYDFSSNILKIANDYYFTINVSNNTSQNFTVTENKLVKLNSKIEIEWVKTIDERRKVNDMSYLIYANGNFINIGKSIWNDVEGFSIIQTDFNGNIIN